MDKHSPPSVLKFPRNSWISSHLTWNSSCVAPLNLADLCYLSEENDSRPAFCMMHENNTNSADL